MSLWRPLMESFVCFPLLVAVLRGDSSVSGTVTFEQSSESAPTTISYHITGNDPDAQRGMHVHQFGDNTNGCTSAGPHCEHLSLLFESLSLLNLSLSGISLSFSPSLDRCTRIPRAIRTDIEADSSSHPVNPFSKTHGAPTDAERHVGDLGNFETDAQGNAEGSITDEQVKLIGQESVLGVCASSFSVVIFSSCGV